MALISRIYPSSEVSPVLSDKYSCCDVSTHEVMLEIDPAGNTYPVLRYVYSGCDFSIVG